MVDQFFFFFKCSRKEDDNNITETVRGKRSINYLNRILDNGVP